MEAASRALTTCCCDHEEVPDPGRRMPLEVLAVDRDILFRPCPELQEAASDWPRLDRPLVPLLNKFWSLGIATDQSCAGHAGGRGLPYLLLRGATARALAALRIAASLLPATRLTVQMEMVKDIPIVVSALYWQTSTGVFTRQAVARLDRRAYAAAQGLAVRAAGLPPFGEPSWESRFVDTVARLRHLPLRDLPRGAVARALRNADAQKLRLYFSLDLVAEADLVGVGVAAGYLGRKPPWYLRPTPLWHWSVMGKCLGCVTEEVSGILLQRGWEPFQLASHSEDCLAGALRPGDRAVRVRSSERRDVVGATDAEGRPR